MKLTLFIEFTFVNHTAIFKLHDSHVPARVFEFSTEFVPVEVRHNAALFAPVNKRTNIYFSIIVSKCALSFYTCFPNPNVAASVVLKSTPAILQAIFPISLVDVPIRVMLEHTFARRKHFFVEWAKVNSIWVALLPH